MLPLFLLFSSHLCKHPTTILSSQNGAFFCLYLLILHRKCQTVTVLGDFELRSVFWYLLWKFLRFLYAEILQWKFIYYFVFLLFFPRDSQCLQSLSVTAFPLLQSAELPILGNVAKQLRFALVSRRKARTAGSAASALLATPSGRQNRTSRLHLQPTAAGRAAPAASEGPAATPGTPKGRPCSSRCLLPSAPGRGPLDQAAGLGRRPSARSPSRRRGPRAARQPRTAPGPRGWKSPPCAGPGRRGSTLSRRVSPAGRKVPNVPADAGGAGASLRPSAQPLGRARGRRGRAEEPAALTPAGRRGTDRPGERGRRRHAKALARAGRDKPARREGRGTKGRKGRCRSPPTLRLRLRMRPGAAGAFPARRPQSEFPGQERCGAGAPLPLRPLARLRI